MREVFQKMRFVPLGSILSGTLVISLVIVGLSMLLLGRAGDVESNPGPGRLEQVPTMKELICLKYKDENEEYNEVCIVDEISAKWEKVGFYLEIEYYTLQKIKKSNQLDAEDCCLDMLSQWLNHKNGTWKQLVDGLKDAKFIQLSQRLRSILSNEEPANTVINIDNLKQEYNNCPSPIWKPLANCEFIRLTIVKEKGKHCQSDKDMEHNPPKDDDPKSIEVDELFNNGKQVLLVEGDPGMGKTMLAHYYCKKWAKEGLSDFGVVYLVKLQELGTKLGVSAAEQILQKVNGLQKLKILLIYDGWDELPNDLRNKSIIKDSIENPPFHVTILITSRRDSSLDLHIFASRFHILGFTAVAIKGYIQKALESEIDDKSQVQQGVDVIHSHFQKHEVIKTICYVPLHISILVHLYLYNCDLPTTRHELFCKLALNCMTRELKPKSPNGRDISFSSFENLPSPIEDHLGKLCAMAYNGVQKGKLVFDCTELGDIVGRSQTTLGLLRGTENIDEYGGTTLSYTFLHLSIQELLAAFHISKMKECEQAKVFECLVRNSTDRFSAVLQFYCAFNKLVNQNIKEYVLDRFNLHHESYTTLNFLRCFFEAQLKDMQFYQKIVQKIGNHLDLSWEFLSAADCMAIGHFLASLLPIVPREVGINISLTQIGHNGFSLIMEQLSKHCDCMDILKGIDFLILICTDISHEDIDLIIHALKSNNSLKEIHIGMNAVDIRRIINFATVNSSLLKLYVNIECLSETANSEVIDIRTVAKFNDGATKVIHISGWMDVIWENSMELIRELTINCNKQLQVQELSILPVPSWLPLQRPIINIGDKLKLLRKYLSNDDCKLKTLDFGKVILRNPDIKSLCETLTVNKSLENLYLNGTHLTAVEMHCLICSLKNNVKLKNLSISNLYDELLLLDVFSAKNGLKELNIINGNQKSSLSTNKQVKSIYHGGDTQVPAHLFFWTFLECSAIHMDHLTIDPFVMIYLLYTETVSEIHLDNCTITEVGREVLVDSLFKCSHLKRLHITNTITMNCLTQVLVAIRYNNSLKELSIAGDFVMKNEEYDALLLLLKINNSLQALNIKVNQFGDKGLNVVADGLHTNRFLQKLNLVSCETTSTGIEFLADALCINQSLQELDVSGNAIGDDGMSSIFIHLKESNLRKVKLKNCCNSFTIPLAKSLATALEANTLLQELDISENNIVHEEMLFIASSLKSNSSLKKLSMHVVSNAKTDSDLEALGEVLLKNKSLEHLKLRWKSEHPQLLLKLFKNTLPLCTLKELSLKFIGVMKIDSDEFTLTVVEGASNLLVASVDTLLHTLNIGYPINLQVYTGFMHFEDHRFIDILRQPVATLNSRRSNKKLAHIKVIVHCMLLSKHNSTEKVVIF